MFSNTFISLEDALKLDKQLNLFRTWGMFHQQTLHFTKLYFPLQNITLQIPLCTLHYKFVKQKKNTERLFEG